MTEIDIADLDAFIFHLNDETRWPAKYFKDVIRYAIRHAKNKDDPPPESIHYTRCCEKFTVAHAEKTKCTP